MLLPGKEWVAPVALVVLTLLAFGQVVAFDFVDYDDSLYVTHNDIVQLGITGPGIVQAFAGQNYGLWHPLTWLSHMLDCQLFGLQPAGHHATNLIFHLANTLLLYAFFRRFSGALVPSFFVSALFAIHPLHAEPVAWVSSRKDVLSTFFWFAALLAYGRYVGMRSWRNYGAVAALYVLGLMAKPMVITLPFVLLLLDVWPLGRFNGDRGVPEFTWAKARMLVGEKAPLFALMALFAAGTVLSAKAGGSLRTLGEIRMANRFLNPAAHYAQYLLHSVFPSGLAAPYPLTGQLMPMGQIVAGAVALAGISCAAVLWVRRWPWFTVGWFWFVGTLVPVSGVIQVGGQAMADRYMYVPLAGLSVAVVWSIAHWVRGRPPAALGACLAGAMVLAVFTGVAWRQAGYWRNSIALCERALAVTEDNVTAHVNLGIALAREGRQDEAMAHYEEALRINPGHGSAYSNIGHILYEEGRYEEAVTYFSEAARFGPSRPLPWSLMGAALAQMGRTDEAIEKYEEALRLDPEYFDARSNLANALLLKGETERAIAHYERVLAKAPNHADAQSNLGAALLLTNDSKGAAVHLKRAVSLAPGDVVARVNYAVALFNLGRTDEAVDECKRAIEADPDYAKAREFLAYMRAQTEGAVP